jgi:uncharacterized repeat protein (TIGR03837 family)
MAERIASLDLFCNVVDNYGDIGVCWRLARQLASEHGLAVRLWVDDMASFARLCAGIELHAEVQQAMGVTVRRWHAGMALPAPEAVADVVIEAFGCRLPDGVVAAMAARSVPPVWINLEYLSAEAWVEGCHRLPSPHPTLPLAKHFFFPGFSAATGGLLRERDLDAQRDAFQADAGAIDAGLASLGVHPEPGEMPVSLFCYPHAPVAALLDALRDDAQPTLLLVPEGVAAEAIGAWTGAALRCSAPRRFGKLRLQAIPFTDQPHYDRLLWSCALNFVRGEDSVVRAQWAQRPLVWQIYPQEEDAHRVKLDAFLERYCAGMAPELAAATRAAWHAWNGDGDWRAAWPAYRQALPALRAHAEEWSAMLAAHGDLAGNLLAFAAELRGKRGLAQAGVT